MVATIAKDKEEFIAMWNEHINELSKLCNNFRDDEYSKMWEEILRIRNELYTIVHKASVIL